MALQSEFTRIKSAMDGYLNPWTLTSDQKLAYIRAALELDLGEYRKEEFATFEETFSFRAVDATTDKFRLLKNATFNDSFVQTALPDPAIIETVPLDLKGAQLAMLNVSRDADATGLTECSFDLCVDADMTDAAAGSFLVADEELALAWDSDLILDIYPSTAVVLRLELKNSGIVRSVRWRMYFIGSKEVLGKYAQIIAMFASARFYDVKKRTATQQGNQQDTIRAHEKEAERLRKMAMGYLTPDMKTSGAGVGKAGTVMPGYKNSYWEKLKRGQ